MYLDIYTRTSVGISFLALLVLAMALVISSHQEENRITIFSSLSVAFRMILNLDFQFELRTFHTIKIIILSGSMLGYLLLALYQSDLTAKMTVSPPQLPIRCKIQKKLKRTVIFMSSTVFQILFNYIFVVFHILSSLTCSRSFGDVTPRGYQVVVAGGTAAVEFLRYSEEGSAMRKERLE